MQVGYEKIAILGQYLSSRAVNGSTAKSNKPLRWTVPSWWH